MFDIIINLFGAASDPMDKLLILIIFVCVLDKIIDLVRSLIGGVRR